MTEIDSKKIGELRTNIMMLRHIVDNPDVLQLSKIDQQINILINLSMNLTKDGWLLLWKAKRDINNINK